MVDIRPEYTCRSPGQGYSRARGFAKGQLSSATIVFSPELLASIRAEALRRGWSLSHMVRFLCEASIDGIE